MISEDESEGFLIDLDHAIEINREMNSGAKERTGTAAFMSIPILDSSINPGPHSFMDDLESIFWLFFGLCTHLEGPRKMRKNPYDNWIISRRRN